MIVGYARTSSLAQVAGLEAQELDLRATGCDKIFREQVSSVAERQQLEAALDYVREGDSICVTKIDRLARSVGDLLAIIARLEAKKGFPQGSVDLGQPSPRHLDEHRQIDVGRHRRRRQAEREAMLSASGRASPRPSGKAAIRGVCRPRDGGLPRYSQIEGGGRQALRNRQQAWDRSGRRLSRVGRAEWWQWPVAALLLAHAPSLAPCFTN